MNTRAWITALLLGLLSASVQAADWRVVILKPRGCNSCTLLEEILKRNSQLQQAVLDDGNGGQVTAAIERRSSPEITAQEWAELQALPWFDEGVWRRQVASRATQILLKRDGVVASAGDITESADLRAARYPPELTMPYVGRDVMEVRNAQGTYVRDLYLRSWNLDWFYRLALDPGLHAARSDAAWIAANPDTLAPPLGSSNVLLMSTASGAADNEIFNALRIEEIRNVLTGPLAVSPSQLRIFYGSGEPRGANALEVRNGRIGLVRRDVQDSRPFTPDTALRIFQSIRARPGSRNLLVLIGHGNPDGAGMWSSPAPLSPATLHALHSHGGGEDVLVSGNCFGGVMARAMSCGFFGARPDIVATGCQADAAEVAQSRDYLHVFFSSLTPEIRENADADRNGVISFAEAHWYASTQGDERNVTYTSVDALADAWYYAHADSLPRTLTVKEVQALAARAPPAEGLAANRLLAGFGAELPLPLTDLAGQATRWRPNSGQPRTMAGQLARRLLFLSNAESAGSDLTRLQSCENQSIPEFLKP